jgi:hypothetical protein
MKVLYIMELIGAYATNLFTKLVLDGLSEDLLPHDLCDERSHGDCQEIEQSMSGP